MDADILQCVYCLQLLNADDDAQRISKSEVAHTSCASAVNDAFFAALDAVYCENLSDVSPPLSSLKAGGAKNHSEQSQEGENVDYAK